jgi:pimeloyl-ACP methyl ester carboxylesterase
LGLALSCFNPEKVKSLSLINPMITHPVSQFSLPELRYFFVSKMKRKDLEFQLSTPIGQAFIIQAASLFRSEEVPERYHLVGRKKEFFTHFVYKLSWILNNEDWDLWDERLKNQTSPKLMIHDRADRLFSTEAYHAFSKKLQNCQLNETLDGGHLSLLSKPVELAQQIQEFLQRIASGKFKKTAA